MHSNVLTLRCPVFPCIWNAKIFLGLSDEFHAQIPHAFLVRKSSNPGLVWKLSALLCLLQLFLHQQPHHRHDTTRPISRNATKHAHL